ncbi:hypothetical protein HC62_11245 [Acetobacter tropicalis]|uniref:Uncharacterized protein n=1 Tax=Acetobacter tropicalis TaxID=104102 RepID=A0A252A7A6_9PROT|nr:hypothetical protein HC62_11245 [Acetobacter tropicalis]
MSAVSVRCLGCSPYMATAEDVRQFKIAQKGAGMPTSTMNVIVLALRFFFPQTLDCPDFVRRLVRVAQLRNIPTRPSIENFSCSEKGFTLYRFQFFNKINVLKCVNCGTRTRANPQ